MLLPAEFSAGIPEIFLSLMGGFLLLGGVFSTKISQWMSELVIATFCLCLLLILPEMFGNERSAFYGMFLANTYTQLAKILILGSAFLVFLMSFRHLEREGLTDFEYPILGLFATLGMMLMVSANDLISMFVGLELQSLPLYVMIAMHRGRGSAAEGAVKYFVLGALSSALILYGSSLVYGYAGTTEYNGLLSVFATDKTLPSFLLIGMSLLIAGLAFKISLAPFHMWAPDVYEGSSSPMVAFLATAPKGAAVLLFIRLCFEVFFHQYAYWMPLVVVLSALSMLVGTFGALYQRDIKRLLAYSSIAHMGFLLLGLVGGSFSGVRTILVYIALYLIMTVGMFAGLLSLTKQGKGVEKIADLSGLARHHPLVAGCLTLTLFSLAGIPPLAGFMAKMGVFMAAIEAGYYGLSLLGVLASVVAAGYYLRIVKVMYFEECPEGSKGGLLETGDSRETTLVMLLMVLAMLFYILIPDSLMEPSYTATKALFFRL